MAPPVTSASYGTSYASQPPTTGTYAPYQPSMQAMSQAPQQHTYPPTTQSQRVDVSQAQAASPSMPHISHHQQHSHHSAQRPAVAYGMPSYHQTMAPSPYPTYAPVSHPDYRRADPTSGGLPSMRTLDHSTPMAGPMGPAHSMMMMPSHHEMGYYPHMMAQHYGMPPEMLGRYPIAHDPRFGLARNPKKEIKRRTKTGCMTCRKRRIKCDETHPTCNNCKKSKRECLGYDPIFKQQNQGQVAPHLHQPQQAHSSPSQQSAHQSPTPQQQSGTQSPSQQHQSMKSEQQQLPPLSQQASQTQQSLSRPSSQASLMNVSHQMPTTMGPASTSSLSSSGVLSTSSHISHQLPGTPSTQASSYKVTPPLSSNYPTPTSTAVSSSSYEGTIHSQSPSHASSYDYQGSIDPALSNGGNAQPRPSYASHDHSHQPRMGDHLPQMRHAEASLL